MGVIRFWLIGTASGRRAGQVMKKVRMDWERRPVGVSTSRLTVMSFTRVTTIGLLIFVTMLLGPRPLPAAPVPVRFAEGVAHGFLLLRTVDGALIASGDLLQVGRGGGVESRMVFHFKDGSLFDETVVFTQQHVFTMQSYHLVQRGPVFAEDTEISLERTGKYRVKTKAHKNGREEVLAGTLELPPDVYNGMVLTIVKNLPKGGRRDRPHRGLYTQAPAHPTGGGTERRAQGADRRTHEDRHPICTQAPVRVLAQALRQAARAHAAGLPGLDHH